MGNAWDFWTITGSKGICLVTDAHAGDVHICMDIHTHTHANTHSVSVERFIHFGLVFSTTFHLMFGCSRRPSELLTCSPPPPLKSPSYKMWFFVRSTFLHLNSKKLIIHLRCAAVSDAFRLS